MQYHDSRSIVHIMEENHQADFIFITQCGVTRASQSHPRGGQMSMLFHAAFHEKPSQLAGKTELVGEDLTTCIKRR